MIYGYIYITENLINGKKYIGQHIGNTHDKKYIGSGKRLWNSIRKYRKENFKNTMVDIAFNKDQLDELEKWYISKFNATKSKNFYNIHEGGSGGNSFANKTEEEIKEYRRKISVSMTGKNNPMFGRKGEKSHMYGKTGENAPNSKPILCIEIDGSVKTFCSATECADYYRYRGNGKLGKQAFSSYWCKGKSQKAMNKYGIKQAIQFENKQDLDNYLNNQEVA